MTIDAARESVSERTMFAVVPDAVPPSAPLLPGLAPTHMPDAGPVGAAGRLSVPLLHGALTALRARAVMPARAVLARRIASAVQTEIDRDTPFILIPVFLTAGAIFYFSASSEPSVFPLLAGVAFLFPLALATRGWPAVHFAIAALLLTLLGALFARLETSRAGTDMLGGEIATQLSGRVAGIDRLASGRVRLTIDVTATARPVLRYAPDRVRVTARKIPPGLEAGSAITGLVRLMPPSGPVRPGSYDFSFESYFDGIGASGFFMRGPELVETSGPSPLKARFQASVERARNTIAARIRDRIGGAEGEIAAALVVGVRAGIPEDVNEALRRAGIYHVISISGLHMALVAGTIMQLLRFGFALFPDFSARRPVKKLAAALAIAGLAGYLFISGGDVAAQRSFIMLAVMLTAVLFDRAALTMRNLAISAVVVTAVSPHEVTGPSFQMSFAATAALVGVYAAWADWRASRPRRAPPKRSLAGRIFHATLLAMAGLAATSLIAGGATAVYSAFHFQQMPSLGLFTNLTAMPVVSILVMPFAVLGMLTMPFGLDGPFFDVMGFGLTVTIAIARWFAERSPIDIIGLVPPAAVIVLTLALLIATVCTTFLRATALPVAFAGLLLLPMATSPDLFVSEDGRLVGLAVGDGKIAVNRARPDDFSLDNWKRAMVAETVIKPDDAKDGEAAPPPVGASVPPGATAGFACTDGLCLATHPSRAVVAYAADAQAARRACGVAAVIVVDDATVRELCPGKATRVITRRDLAQRGSAAVSFSGAAVAVDYAVEQPYRLWHEHRRFSREARGLAPYRRPEPAAATAGAGR